MSEWVRQTLGEVVDADAGIKTGPFGTSLSASEYSNTGVPVISVGEVGYGEFRLRQETPRVSPATTSRLSEYLLREGDIVFGRKGAVDRSAWVSSLEEGWFLGSDGIRVRPQTTVSSRFLSYQLQTRRVRQWLLQHAGGSTLLSLNQPTLSRVPLAMPAVGVQQAIAEVLGALDDKIAANTALAATASSTITTAFSLASMSLHKAPLLDELTIEFGEPFGGAHFSEPGQGRPLIRIRDLKTFKSQVWTTETRAKEILVKPGDVIVGMDAEFRATSWLGEPGMLNQRVMRARHQTFGNALVREVLRKPLAEVEGEKSATTVIHLNKADLSRKTLLIPSNEHLVIFEALAEPLYASIIALAAENRTLAATRDSLLPQLMSGKLRVRDAEKPASEAGA